MTESTGWVIFPFALVVGIVLVIIVVFVDKLYVFLKKPKKGGDD